MSWNLRDHESFCYICQFLREVFAFCMKKNPDGKIKSFYELLMKELDNFADGRKCRHIHFCFTRNLGDYYGNSDYEFTSFNIETGAINIFSGGDFMDKAYMDIEYCLYDNGDEDEQFNLDIDSFISFIKYGAVLEIELPKEYK